MSSVEQTVLGNLISNEPYMRKVLPFIKPEYFQGVYNLLFKEVAKYVAKYNTLPTKESLKVAIEESDKFNNDQFTAAIEILPNLFTKDYFYCCCCCS